MNTRLKIIFDQADQLYGTPLVQGLSAHEARATMVVGILLAAQLSNLAESVSSISTSIDGHARHMESLAEAVDGIKQFGMRVRSGCM